MFFNSSIKKKPLSNIDKGLKQTLELNNKSIRSIYGAELSTLHLSCLYKNIDTYISKFYFFIDTIESGKIVSPSLISNITYRLKISNFYLDDKNYYTDYNLKTKEYSEALGAFLTIYKNIENNKNKTFNEEKSLFNLSYFLNNSLNILNEIHNLMIVNETFIDRVLKRFN